MSQFHDDYPQYELMAHHSEEEGRIKRRKLWNVFWILLGVTIVELIIGFKAADWGLLQPDRTSTVSLKVIFIGLTLVKAFYIVYKFMHLGDEKKDMRSSILYPYLLFAIYLILLLLVEANYVFAHKEQIDPILIKQKEELNHEAGQHHKKLGEEQREAEHH